PGQGAELQGAARADHLREQREQLALRRRDRDPWCGGAGITGRGVQQCLVLIDQLLDEIVVDGGPRLVWVHHLILPAPGRTQRGDSLRGTARTVAAHPRAPGRHRMLLPWLSHLTSRRSRRTARACLSVWRWSVCSQACCSPPTPPCSPTVRAGSR